MKLLDEYFDTQRKIYEYFKYVEDWVVIPINDAREMFWILVEGDSGGGYVRYAETKENLLSEGDYYEDEIYTQRFLSKWIYPADDYTMICVDTHTDGNKFLQVFDNSKRVIEVDNGN